MIGHDTPWLRFLGKSVQGKPMGCVLGGAVEAFCHALFINTPEYGNFHHVLTLCQVSKLFEHVKAVKKSLKEPEE